MGVSWGDQGIRPDPLFHGADPGATAWTGPPPEIATVRPPPHASPTTSLPAAPLAMLGKRWVNRYLRNRGGSVADRSRDRQRKLDGLQKWHFHLAIESLPVMLRLASPSLGCALPEYFWTSCTVVGVIIAITVLGITSCLPHPRRNILLQRSLPNTSHSHPNCPQVPDAWRHCICSFAVITHCILPLNQKSWTD